MKKTKKIRKPKNCSLARGDKDFIYVDHLAYTEAEVIKLMAWLDQWLDWKHFIAGDL